MIVNKPKKKKTISRYAVLYIIMAVIFGTIFCKLLYLQVYKYDDYKEKADTSSTKFISESAPRGLIYDSEGNILATSEQTYVLTYMQTTESANAIFSTLNKVFKVLSENGENFEDNLLLKVNSDGQFYFAFKSDDSDIKEATELLFKSDRGLKDEVIEELYKDHEGDFTDEQLANINAKLLEITPEELSIYYPSASNDAKEKPERMEEVRKITALVDEGIEPYISMWKDIVEVSKQEIKKTYDYLNCHFDLWEGELSSLKYIKDTLKVLEPYMYESDKAKVIALI